MPSGMRVEGYRPPGEGVGCVVCGAALSPHERAAGPSCRKLACLTALAIRARAAAERERRADLDTAVAWFSDREDALGEAEALQVAAVPFADRPLVPADPERVALFRETLTAAMAQAVGMGMEAPEPAAGQDPERVRTLGWGCAMCTGRCCSRGGTHAFLSAEELALKLAAEPSLGPDGLLAVYLDALPERSAEGSCVFHAEAGCALPREARARICNDWLCQGLVEWARALEGSHPSRVRVASVDQGVVRRAVVVEAGAAALERP